MPLLLPPLSLYVHIPWCMRKCHYCDFNSYAVARIPEDDYCSALLRDWRHEAPVATGRELGSIFFGGGTPSLFAPESIAKLLEVFDRTARIKDDAEITLEANPENLSMKRLKGLRAAGVNRLSLGAQSFDRRQLAALGRGHGPEAIHHAVSWARRAGFGNINIDLMHSLPRQSQLAAREDLRAAIALEPEHISWYQLTIEPNTHFAAVPPPVPDEDWSAEVLELGVELLKEGGYARYEVSAFSRPGYCAAHNLNYWQFGDYVGIGAGAHGKLSDLDGQCVERSWKTRLPKDYIKGQRRNSRVLSRQDLRLEFMINALRLSNGVSAKWFEERTGLGREDVAPELSRLLDDGLLSSDPARIACSPLGFRFLNEVLEAFIEPPLAVAT